MPLVKLTQFFEVNTCYGWTETWYKQYSEGARLETIAAQDGSTLMDFRQKMLAPEASITALSLSVQTVNGDSLLQYQNRPGTCPGNCDSPHTAIYCIARAAGDTLRKAVFVRGQPDDVVMFGGKFQPAPPPAPPSLGIAQFIAAGTSYFNFLKNQSFGWLKNNRTKEGKVLSFTVPDGERTVQLNCSPGFFPAVDPNGPPVFTRVRVTYKRKKTVLNRTMVVQIRNETTCTTIEEMNPFPITSEGLIVRYTPALQTFVDGSWNFQKSGERKAGKVSLHTPGRSKVRVLA